MDVTSGFVNLTQTANRLGNIAAPKWIFESSVDNLVALAGGGSVGATKIASEISRFTTVATAGDSAVLPPATAGLTLMVINHGAQPMQVYGDNGGSDVIDDQPAATGVTQMVNSVVIYVCTTPGRWYANGLGTGFAGAFETQSYADGLTAHAGGGQGSAWPIVTMMSRFTTVASAGDSAILPTDVAGMNLIIINASSTSMNVFPDSGSTINALSANTALALGAGKSCTFFSTIPGAWHTVPSTP
jgi:hypothetical protein